MLFIEHDEWMRRTYSRVYSRSTELKTLDAALAEASKAQASEETWSSWYRFDGRLSEQATQALELDTAMRRALIRKVRDAFNRWVGSRTDDWRTSGRNSDGAVTQLYDQLVYHLAQERVPQSEKEALDAIRKGRDESIPLLFKDCWVSSKTGSLQKLKDKKTKASLQVAGGTIVIKSGAHKLLYDMIEGVVEEAFGATLGQLKAEGGGGNSGAYGEIAGVFADQLKSLLADIAPVAGLVKNVGTIVVKSVQLYIRAGAYDELYKINLRLPENSDPRAAIEAVVSWQRQDIARTTSSLVRNTASLGGQLATTFTAGGAYGAQAGIAIANAVVEIVEILSDLGLQYRAKKALTTHLNSPQLDRQIIAQSPLAAAIYILNVPLSHVALSFVNMGAPAWREEVVILQKHGPFKTMVTECERVIDSSRYEIHRMGDPFRTREGKTKGVKAKEAVGMQPLRGKVKMDAMGPNDVVKPV